MAAYGDIRPCVHEFAVNVKIINKRWESNFKTT